MKIKIPEKLKSIKVRLPLMFVSGYLIIIPVIVISMYFNLKNKMIDEYVSMSKGTVTLSKSVIDADRISEYIEKNFELEDYRDTWNRLERIKNSNPDIIYMYVYEMHEDGGHVVFDVCDDPDEPGSVYELDEAFEKYKAKLLGGRKIPPIYDMTKYGYLLTYCEPLHDSFGNSVAYVFVDYSMDSIRKDDMRLILKIITISVIVLGFVLYETIKIVNKKIADPINKMAEVTKKFSYDTEEERQYNVTLVENLKIKTGDEIERLYDEFVTVMREGFDYWKDLDRAGVKIEELDRRAYKDSLTGVGNKSAYNEEMRKLTLGLREGKTEFAILMADINNLKYINDTYGHREGDMYIRGSCNIVCDTFKRSKVFRIGGDEFVTLIEGEDFKNRNELYNTVLSRYNDAYSQTDKEPWERFSASLGMADAEEGDETANMVFNRADKLMYENKMEFKKKNGSYR